MDYWQVVDWSNGDLVIECSKHVDGKRVILMIGVPAPGQPMYWSIATDPINENGEIKIDKRDGCGNLGTRTDDQETRQEGLWMSNEPGWIESCCHKGKYPFEECFRFYDDGHIMWDRACSQACSNRNVKLDEQSHQMSINDPERWKPFKAVCIKVINPHRFPEGCVAVECFLHSFMDFISVA